MKAIGKIYTDFPEKFGIPRQSGLVKQLEGRIILKKRLTELKNIHIYGYFGNLANA